MNAGMDVERARYNMVEQQIRTWEVLDQQVLDLLFTVRREDFVPPQYRSLAFVDMEREYAELDRNGDGTLEYTARLISTKDRRDGLYWETQPGEPPRSRI